MPNVLESFGSLIKFFPLFYIIFVIGVITVSLVLMYHWRKYSSVSKLRFQFLQAVYLIVIILFLLTAGGFLKSL